jgi:signal transduction histidine kinase
MYHLAFATLLFTLVVNTFFGLIVLLRVYQKAFGWYFVMTVFGIILWVIGDAGLLFARDAHSVHVFAELFYIAPMFTPISIWFFALTFPENKPLPKLAPLLAAVPLAVVMILFLGHFNFFIHDIAITNSLNVATPAKPGFYFYSAFFSFFFILVYIAFWKKLRNLRGIEQSRVLYTFFGVLTGSMLALVSNLTLPTRGVREFLWLGPFFTLLFPASVVVAIVRHRLFDIRIMLARSVGYVVTLASLAIVYILVALIIVNHVVFPNARVVFSQQIVYAVLAAVLAFSFQPIRRILERGTNRIFYRDAYDSQQFFNEFNKTLVTTIALDDVLKRTSMVISQYLKAQYCLIGIRAVNGEQRIVGTQVKQFEPSEVAEVMHITPHIHQVVILADNVPPDQRRLHELLSKNDISALVRITDNVKKTHEGLGYIVLGPKKSGNPYTPQDVKVLEATANELVIAIQNALHFEEIQNFNRTLQARVNKATNELRKTNDKLKALDQTKDEFITMASHQLRTPLTSAKGYLSMVLEGDAGKLNANQEKLLEQSYLSSQRMVYLISDLLNLSRLNTGKFVIEPSSIDLSEIVKAEVDQLTETAKSRDLQLVYDKPASFPKLMLDETKIHQVVMNFIDNAIYYTPAGGTVTVELRETPTAVEYTVHDTGIGVPKSVQHKLFTKFYRAQNAQQARPDGTGLGLFMAKKVVAAQGGTILFESEEGKGSTFGFRFNKTQHAVKSVSSTPAKPAEQPVLTN